ncbi:MAG: hypothetical protein ABI333_10725 [bacterium]
MTTGRNHITPDALEAAIRDGTPALVLVEPSLLRRVVRRHRGVAGAGLWCPHATRYWLSMGELRRLAPEELGALPGADAGGVLLLARPDADELLAQSPDEALLAVWRARFHLRVHWELEGRRAVGALTPAVVRERIHRLGQVEYDEVRAVLRDQQLLLPARAGEGADHVSYAELVAVYLELRHFEPARLGAWFPSLGHRRAEIEELLAAGLDVELLLTETRPAGCPDPATPQAEAALGAELLSPPVTAPPGRAAARLLLRRARVAQRRGNSAQAARLSLRAAQCADPRLAAEAGALTEDALDGLAARLAELVAADSTTAQWRTALRPLLARTAAGYARAEARLLYDLQKACAEAVLPYRVDLVEWVLSLGRRPVRRPLRHVPVVRAHRHVQVARRRLANVSLSRADREPLATLLDRAARNLEHRLRETIRPVLEQGLQSAALEARSVVEGVARAKMVEELLDRLVERGFLSMSELRDAVARNAAKLPDLSGPGELLRGDGLLRLDHALAAPLEGVYRRGEGYLRWLQRLSSLVFGTSTGRFLTRFVLLPAGGAFVALEGLQHLLGPILGRLAGVQVRLATWPAMLALAVLLLGVINVPAVRRIVFGAARGAWRALTWLGIGLPRTVLALPAVRSVLDSNVWRLLLAYLLKPALLAAPFAAPLVLLHAAPWAAWTGALACLCGMSLLRNSRLGQRLEERALEGLLRGWRRVRNQILPGLVRFILWLFDWLLVQVERLLYRVDEWLRYRPGDSALGVVVKPVLGLCWFAITYVLRIYVNLLIEPQVNPVKHFPVVTVSHKIILPMTFTITEIVRVPLAPLGSVLANTIAVATVFLLPGVFGFLVWELKENWRLYRANRPPDLRPAVVGSHGETVARLVRPGFHSGTLPKLYSRLRRAQRSLAGGRRRAAHRTAEGLHHVEEGVRRFVDRDLLRLLCTSPAWANEPLHIAGVQLTSNRIIVRLARGRLSEEPLCDVAFDEQSGWLVAGLSDRGGLAGLSGEQRGALRTAVAGLYKLAGVDLVRQQLEAVLPGSPPYDVADEGMVVWPGGYQNEVLYALGDGAELVPAQRLGTGAAALPTLTREQLFFREHPFGWTCYEAAWEAGGLPVEPVLPGVTLLPGPGGRT